MILSIRRNFPTRGCFSTKIPFPYRVGRQETSARLAALIYWPDSAGSSRSDIKPIKRGVTSKIAKVTDSFLTIVFSPELSFRSFRSFLLPTPDMGNVNFVGLNVHTYGTATADQSKGRNR